MSLFIARLPWGALVGLVPAVTCRSNHVAPPLEPRSVSSLPTPVVDEFVAGLRVEVVAPGDSDYEALRVVWNRRHDRTPGLIVRCVTNDDVVRTVNFARDEQLVLAVRSGGHSQAGHSTCNGGVVLDVSPMNAIEVDGPARTVRTGPGARVGDLDRATARLDLALVLGTCPSVGIAGLSLGGGLGWLSPAHGAACDNLLSIDVVLATGELVTASADQNSGLFWALRGGGGNFGVATSLTFRAHPSETLASGRFVYGLNQAPLVFAAYAAFASPAPEQLAAQLRVAPTPQGSVLVLEVLYLGDTLEGERLLQPLQRVAPSLSEMIEPVAYPQWQASSPDPPPGQSVLRTGFLPTLNDEVVAVMSAAAQVAPPGCPLSLFRLAGATTQSPSGGTAFAQRSGGYNYFASAAWMTEPQREPAMRWLEELTYAVRPHTRGAYVNILDDVAPTRVVDAYGESYTRLSRVKSSYDPTNLFRLNPNVSPT